MHFLKLNISFKVQGRISQEVPEYFITETMDGIVKKKNKKKKNRTTKKL